MDGKTLKEKFQYYEGTNRELKQTNSKRKKSTHFSENPKNINL
jgi:hypothetical protein